MTELTVRDSYPTVPDSALATWAYQAQQAHQIAQSLARTSFVPATMRGKADDVTAAILAGDELGLRPMAALRSMDVIQGTPALRAHAMRGLVQAAGHEVELVDSTETRCRMRGRRKGSDAWQTVTWTIERASKLGLLGKPEWKKQPQTMLVARATGEICRLIASDVLHAMPYAAEELGTDDPAETTTAAPASTRRAARRVQAKPAPTAALPAEPESEFDDVPSAAAGAPAAPEPSADAITRAQLTKLHTALNKAGIIDRDDGLAYYGKVIGRDVESSKDLTKAEASHVIDSLEPPPEPPPTIEPDEPGLDDDWPPVPPLGGAS